MTPPSDLAAIIADARETGATGLKLYSEIAPELVHRIVQEARGQGMKVWSHASIFPSRPSDAVSAGVDAISHNGLLYAEGVHDLPGDYETATREWMPRQEVWRVPPRSNPFERLFADMAEKGTIYEPTLAGSEYSEKMAASSLLGGIDWKALRAWGCEITRAAHQAGVPIAAGTDTYGTEPVQRELELLVECGLSPLEALTAATLVNARVLGIDETHGLIAPGKAADLLVLTADPTADIRSVGLVVKAGRVYSH